MTPIQLDTFIQAWNYHPIPRAGKPINGLKNKKNFLIPSNVLPGAGEAIALYKSVRPNSKFKPGHHFVEDIIPNEHKNARDELLIQEIRKNDSQIIIQNVINFNFELFIHTFLTCVNIMERFLHN